MKPDELLAAIAKLLAFAYDDASSGSRAAVAALIDLISRDLEGYQFGYSRGLAEGLRRPSRSRRERSGWVH